MRKPGWYWVKFGKGNDWECKRFVSSGYWASHDGVMETEPSEVGPRIPTPDEKPQSRPAAYAVFSENGNIQIWSADPIQAESLRQEYGDEVQELYVSDSPNP